LKSISKRARYQSKRQRAMILLASSTGMSAPRIARLVRTDESHVRRVIHAFNEEGFGSLDPNYRGGRPKKTTPEQRDRIVAVARTRPDCQGVPLTRWSLPKLRAHLAGMGVFLSEETLRQTLIGAGLSHQRTPRGSGARTRTFSPRRSAYSRSSRSAARRGGRLLRRDGPDSVDSPPRLGLDATEAARAAARDILQEERCALPLRGLRRPRRSSARTPARAQERPRGARLLQPDPDALRPAPAHLPGHGQPLDPQDPGDRPVGRDEQRRARLHATYASFLNRIECHFWAIGEFVIKNADHPDWNTLAKAMADHIRYRNGPHRDQRLIMAERRLLIAA
jgi:transposase